MFCFLLTDLDLKKSLTNYTLVVYDDITMYTRFVDFSKTFFLRCRKSLGELPVNDTSMRFP